MEWIVLGSGTAVPHAHRASSAHWLQTGDGSILLDAGSGVGLRMAQEGLDWPNLDAIWISHFHLDHLGGLPPLLFGLRHAPQTQARTKPLTIYGPEGLRRWLETVAAAANSKIFQQPFPLLVVEVTGESTPTLLPGLNARFFHTPHTAESLAIRLTAANGASVVYTSDTSYATELGEFARDCDLLVVECSFPHNKPVMTHLELADVLQIAQTARPRVALLTHLYPEWDAVCLQEELHRQNAHPSCELIEAADGLCLKIV
jgi:ribonuclease BN (tRNA processing enzyme)